MKTPRWVPAGRRTMKTVIAGSGARETATMMMDVETVLIDVEIPTLQLSAIEATLEEVVMIGVTVETESTAKAVTVEMETPGASKAVARTKERKAIQMEKVMPAKETKVTAGKPTRERRALATAVVVGRTSLNTWVR